MIYCNGYILFNNNDFYVMFYGEIVGVYARGN